MPGQTVVSRSPDHEDVVVLRALGHLRGPRYALLADGSRDVDGWHGALDDAGWTGRVHRLAGEGESLRAQVAALAAQDLHLLWLVAGPGPTAAVLRTLAGTRLRPWVLLVRDTPPDDPAPAGFSSALFDGVSRYFVADGRTDLLPALSYPACSLDAFRAATELAERERSEDLLRQVLHWRRLAVTGWADAVAESRAGGGPGSGAEAERLRAELDALRSTLSWRVTRPLRGIRLLLGRALAR